PEGGGIWTRTALVGTGSRAPLKIGVYEGHVGGRQEIAAGRRPVVSANTMKTPLARATIAPARRSAGRMVSHSRTVRACSGPRIVAESPCMHISAPNKR